MICSDPRGLSCTSGWYEFNAAGSFFHAAVHFYYVARGSLGQPPCGVEPARHPRVPQAHHHPSNSSSDDKDDAPMDEAA